MCGHKCVFWATSNFYFKYIERALLDLDVCFIIYHFGYTQKGKLYYKINW